MAGLTNFINTIAKPFLGLFSSSPKDTVPFSHIPGDVISVFFSLLNERSKANLGKVCKTLNAAYINVSPIGRGCKQLYANLKDEAVELAKATEERGLKESELHSRLYPLKFASANEQLDHFELVMKADDKLTNFYENFSKTLTTLNTNFTLESSGYFVALANQIIRSSFKTANVDPAKLDTVTREFDEKYYYDLCAFYSSQPIDAITIESFQAEVASIQRWFSNTDMIDLETELRKAIKAKHDSTEFNHIHGEFLNPAADSPRFVAIRADHQTKLLAGKNALQAQIETLGGPNGFKSAVDAAFQERQNAEAEKNKAYIALVDAFQQPGDGLNEYNEEATLDRIIAVLVGAARPSAGHNVVAIESLFYAYQQKAQAFEEKNSAYDYLNEIAQYTGTTLSGGWLHEVNANLQPAALDAAARNKAAKIAGFYQELNLVVGDHNKVARSQALHHIIG